MRKGSMDTKPITEVMEDAAQVFERKAKDLRGLAKQLSETGDLSICGEAISVCCNLANIRIDLLSVRPVRALTRELERANISSTGGAVPSGATGAKEGGAK